MNDQYPFQVSPLPYSYLSLMPFCDPDTMYLHHHRLCGRTVYQLNRLVALYRLWDLSLEELILQDLNIPTVHQNQIKDAAGCLYNHTLYFDGITGTAAQPPVNTLTQQLSRKYGSMQDFQRLLIEAAASLPGVGWVWLVSEGDNNLHIVTTQNNGVVNLNAVFPILVVDVWEHAYFLVHQFDQASYIRDWFSLLDWERAEKRFLFTQTPAQCSAQSAPH